MKKLTITILLTLAYSNASVILAGSETDLNTERTQVQAKSNVKKDLAKSIAGLMGAGLVGYISFRTGINGIENSKDGWINKADNLIYNNLFAKILNLKDNDKGKPDNIYHRYIANFSLPILSAIAAYECGKYGTNKMAFIANSKLPSNWKQSISLFGRYFKSKNNQKV